MPVYLDLQTSGTPETEFLTIEEGQQVAEAINILPALQRETILLRYFHGLSLNEISQVLNIPVGTVKSRLSLGLQRLKERIKVNP